MGHEQANGFVDPSVMCSLCCLLSLQDYIWEKNDMILYSSEHTFLQLFRTFGIFFGPSMRGRPCAHHICGIPCLFFFVDPLPPSTKFKFMIALTVGKSFSNARKEMLRKSSDRVHVPKVLIRRVDMWQCHQR